MREIWENPFANAHLKIERANKHIADFEERLRSSPDSYAPRVNIDAKTGQQFLYYGPRDRELGRDLALITGDAIHNLYSALDFMWRGVIQQVSPDGFGDTTKLPFSNSREHLKSSLLKTAKIGPNSALFDFTMNFLKCYPGGDPDICAIHQLDVDDKHHLLRPIIHIVTIDGVEFEDENGMVTFHTFAATNPLVTHRIPIPDGNHVKNNGEVTIRVSFGQKTLANNREVVPTLRFFAGKVRHILRRLQRMR